MRSNLLLQTSCAGGFRPATVILSLFLAILALTTILTTPVSAQTSLGAFTYQGQLKDGDVGVDASGAQMCFRLWDSATGGHQIGDIWVVNPVEIAGGLFTVVVDFGEEAFVDPTRWLEIGVDVAGGHDYTWMTPRQQLTPAPFAVQALHGGDNPWTITGSDISFGTGKVGIGTAAPVSQLDVSAMDTAPIIKGVSLEHGSSEATGILGVAEGSHGTGVQGSATSPAGNTVGVLGESYSASGVGVNGRNLATSGNAIGVLGRSQSPDGYAGYFDGRGYFTGYVGIGAIDPQAALDVDGTVKTTGFQLDAAPHDGYVLTSDASGVSSWQPAAAGAGFWQGGVGSDIYYNDGNVGIGTGNPNYPLTVLGSGVDPVFQATSTDDGSASGIAISGTVTAPGGCGVYGYASSADAEVSGVWGRADSPSGNGVKGSNASQPGGGAGVYGTASGVQSNAILGIHSATSGLGKAILGRSDSPDGYGGYFIGQGYFSGNLGIGTTSPQTALDVQGTVSMNGFHLGDAPQDGFVLTSDASGTGSWQPASAGSSVWNEGSGGKIYYNDGNVGIGTSSPSADLDVQGTVEMSAFRLSSATGTDYVLTSDASGNGTWQPSADLSLPYEGSTSTSGSAFKVTNSGTSNASFAVEGVLDSPSSSSSAAAGFFDARGSLGYAVKAKADANSTIYAQYSGTDTDYAAVYGYSNYGYGGKFVSDGNRGAFARADTGLVAQGLGASGVGVYAKGYAAGLVGESSSAQGAGIVAVGSGASAKLYGNVYIYEYGTENTVIELGKGLDYAEGFDVTGGREAACPGCVLVIDPQQPGNLVLSTQSYDARVAGVVAGANGLGSGVRLGTGQFDHDVALAGRVYCNVIALDEDIQPGDMLTTSDVPGYAMKVTAPARAQGAVLGKAMQPLCKGEKGQIMVLVTLQ